MFASICRKGSGEKAGLELYVKPDFLKFQIPFCNYLRNFRGMDCVLRCISKNDMKLRKIECLPLLGENIFSAICDQLQVVSVKICDIFGRSVRPKPLLFGGGGGSRQLCCLMVQTGCISRFYNLSVAPPQRYCRAVNLRASLNASSFSNLRKPA